MYFPYGNIIILSTSHARVEYISVKNHAIETIGQWGKRHPDPISRFTTIHFADRPTDRQTSRMGMMHHVVAVVRIAAAIISL